MRILLDLLCCAVTHLDLSVHTRTHTHINTHAHPHSHTFSHIHADLLGTTYSLGDSNEGELMLRGRGTLCKKY